MGKFRNFLISEQIGLGDLGHRINSLHNSQRLSNAISGAFLGSDQTGSEGSPTSHMYPGHDLWLPSTDITIPTQQRSGRITTLQLTKNPIYVRLSDGTEAHFTYDEWKKIHGNPQIGKVMTISFQRHPDDWTQQHSTITRVEVN